MPKLYNTYKKKTKFWLRKGGSGENQRHGATDTWKRSKEASKFKIT